MNTKQDFIYVDHDMDNYEEIIDISQIIFIRTNFKYQGNDNPWDYVSTMVFRNGHKETIHLTEEGYNKMLEKLKTKSKTKVKKPRTFGVCPICGNDMVYQLNEENETNTACVSCHYQGFDEEAESGGDSK